MVTALAARVLVVDDLPYLAHALNLLFERRGYEVAEAHCCADARGAGGVFDVAVIDLQLPDGTGVGLAEELLESRRVLLAVFYTGGAPPDVLGAARRLGPVWDKGTGPLQLVEHVHALLSRGQP